MTTRALIVIAAITIASTANAQVTVPHQFSAGTPAVAQQVNENFQSLAEGINGFINDGVYVKPTISMYWETSESDPNPNSNITYTVPAGQRLFVNAVSCSMRTPYAPSLRNETLIFGYIRSSDSGDRLVTVMQGQTVWDFLLLDINTMHFYNSGEVLRVWGRRQSPTSAAGGIECVLHGVLRDM